ncbi:hypothetical protein [Paenibacillus cremeus]|nr:hypothetical protein [Paenibacillus cremeus]
MLIDGGGRLMLSTKQVPDPAELESLTNDLQGELGHRHGLS